MTFKAALLSASLLPGLAVVAPVRAQSMVGRLLGQTTPQAILRPDMAAKIRDLLTGRGIPLDVANASLSALAAGLVSGTPTSATTRGFSYAWSIAGGPLDSRNCRAVAGGWKRATSARSELTENGPWCWSNEGWIPVKNQFDGELSPVQAQAPVQAPAPAPKSANLRETYGHRVRETDEIRYALANGDARVWAGRTVGILYEFRLGDKIHVTGEVEGGEWLRVVTPRSGFYTGYVLAEIVGRNPPPIAPAVVAPAPTSPLTGAALNIEDVDAPQIVVLPVHLKAAPDMTSANLASLAVGDRVQQTGVVHGPVAFVRVRTASGQVGFLLGGQVAPAPKPPVQAQAAPQAPTAAAVSPAPLQPEPVQTPPQPVPSAPAVVVQTPPPPPPVTVQAPPPPAPAVVQAAPPPAAPAIAAPAPAPAPVVTAAPPPVAPPAPPPKPRVKTDL